MLKFWDRDEPSKGPQLPAALFTVTDCSESPIFSFVAEETEETSCASDIEANCMYWLFALEFFDLNMALQFWTLVWYGFKVEMADC